MTKGEMVNLKKILSIISICFILASFAGCVSNTDESEAQSAPQHQSNWQKIKDTHDKDEDYVVMQNEKGVKISYLNVFDATEGSLRTGRTMTKFKEEKICDFKPDEFGDNLIVVKLTQLGQLNMDTDKDFKDVGKQFFLAVISKDDLKKEKETVGNVLGEINFDRNGRTAIVADFGAEEPAEEQINEAIEVMNTLI